MITEQIDKFIAENGGNTRDALNVALARLEASKITIEYLKESLDNAENITIKLNDSLYF